MPGRRRIFKFKGREKTERTWCCNAVTFFRTNSAEQTQNSELCCHIGACRKLETAKNRPPRPGEQLMRPELHNTIILADGPWAVRAYPYAASSVNSYAGRPPPPVAEAAADQRAGDGARRQICQSILPQLIPTEKYRSRSAKHL